MQEVYTDKPISAKEEDRFQRYEFAKRIASIVANPRIDKSLVVGLYGKWGEGKTSIMNFIERELPSETVVVKFNPWLFSNEEQLLKYYFTSIANALGKSDKKLKENIGKYLSKYGEAVSIMAVAGSIKYPVLSPFKRIGRSIKAVGDSLKDVSIETLKKRIDNIIVDSGKNIVVFVDDIDRLDIDEVQYVFKLVKLVADFPRTCYILAFDENVVAKALSPKYGQGLEDGYRFLEKIIQVPLKVPFASSTQLRKYTIDLLNESLDNLSIELSREESQRFLEAFDSALLPFVDSKRKTIRYANTLAFSIPLLKGEVNIVDLMIIEGIKILHPDMYEFIKSNRSLFISPISHIENLDGLRSNSGMSQEDYVKSQIDIPLSKYEHVRKRLLIETLLQLFPKLQEVYKNIVFGSDDTAINWSKNQRICSGRYFQRYFSYCVQEGEIPDRYFEQFIENLGNNTQENIISAVCAMLDSYSAFELVDRLSVWDESLSEIPAKKLVVALSEFGNRYPKEDDFHFATTYARASKVIVDIVINSIPEDQQLAFIIELLSKMTDFSFAMEINYWIMYRVRRKHELQNIAENEVELQKVLVHKFKEKLNSGYFFTLIEDIELIRILLWWSDIDKESLDKLLFSKLNDEPDFALDLLKAFTPTITSRNLRDGKSVEFKSGFFRKEFNKLSKVIDVNLLNRQLIKVFGNKPYHQGPDYEDDREPWSDELIVSIFQFFIENPSDEISKEANT